jgi:hypothetical protein
MFFAVFIMSIEKYFFTHFVTLDWYGNTLYICHPFSVQPKWGETIFVGAFLSMFSQDNHKTFISQLRSFQFLAGCFF